jgi:ketosteroid isomerase-like protein
MTNDERTIRNVVDTWMSATKAGDQRTVLSLMADGSARKPLRRLQWLRTRDANLVT